MAVQTAYPGTQEIGQKVSTAKFSQMPGGLLGFAERTVDQTGISGQTLLTGLDLTVTLGEGRAIEIFGSCQVLAGGDQDIFFAVYEGVTELARLDLFKAPSSAYRTVMKNSVVLTPSAGAHTYQLSLEPATLTCDMQATASIRAQIRVMDIGLNPTV